MVAIPQSESFAQVFIHPISDTDLEFDETVTLTLVLTNGRVVNRTNRDASDEILIAVL